MIISKMKMNKLPPTCAACKYSYFQTDNHRYCMQTGRKITITGYSKRLSFCPLMEVKDDRINNDCSKKEKV